MLVKMGIAGEGRMLGASPLGPALDSTVLVILPVLRNSESHSDSQQRQILLWCNRGVSQFVLRTQNEFYFQY